MEKLANKLNNSSSATNYADIEIPKNIEIIRPDKGMIVFCNNYKEVEIYNNYYLEKTKIKYNKDIYIEILWAGHVPIFTPKKYKEECMSDIVEYKHFVVQSGLGVFAVSCVFKIK